MYKFEDNHNNVYISKEALMKEHTERHSRIEHCNHVWDPYLFLSFIPVTNYERFPWMLEKFCADLSSFQLTKDEFQLARNTFLCEKYNVTSSSSSMISSSGSNIRCGSDSATRRLEQIINESVVIKNNSSRRYLLRHR
jgi:hypothetical protein